MTPPATRHLVVAALTLLVTALALLGPAASAAPGTGTRAKAAARAVDTSDPLEVVIRDVTPSTIPERGKDEVTVSGTITNRSDSTWTGLSVYLLTSYAPITTEADLVAAQQSDPRLDLGGDRLITPGLYEEVPDLEAGEQTSFELTVKRDELQISGDAGVYWLSVQVLGSGDEGRLDGADGRARTFIPLVPDDTPTTSLALGMQFRNHVVRSPTGELQFLPSWQQVFTKDGRFGRLLQLSRRSGEFPLTWLVDPAVLQAAESVSQGNPSTTLTPDPGKTAAEQAADGSDDEPTADAALPDEARTAGRWLRKFDRDASGHTVLALPYADLDVSAAQRAGADDLLPRALTESAAVLDSHGVSSRPVVSPLTGYLSPAAAADLDPDLPALLSTNAVPELAESGVPVAERTTGGRIGVVPTRISLFQPQPSDETAALGVRQSLLSQVALHALSPTSGEQPMAVLLPPGWDPGEHWKEAHFFQGLDVPWIQPASLNGLLDRDTGGVQVDPERLSYPDSEADSEIPPYLVASAEGVMSDTVTLEELLTNQTTVGDTLDQMALLGTSTWSRRFPGIADERLGGVQGQIHGWLNQVQVRGPSFVTMSSETGRFPITIVNGLDEPVTVGLRTSVSGGSLDVVTPDPVDLPAGGRQAMRIEATSSGIGIHQVSIEPVTSSGKILGEGATLSVRSSKVGLIVWVIMAVGAAFLFIAIAIRLTRRIGRYLRRRRAGAPA